MGSVHELRVLRKRSPYTGVRGRSRELGRSRAFVDDSHEDTGLPWSAGTRGNNQSARLKANDIAYAHRVVITSVAHQAFGNSGRC